MTDSLLSPQQLIVIGALSNGATTTDAAAQAGVHRNTIAHWRRNLLPFQNALANAQYTRALLFREKIEEQADRAIETIQEVLTDPKAPASVRLRAALAVMKVACMPPEPKKRTELEIKKVVVQETQPDPPAQNSPNLHKNAQSPTPEVGRNTPCPCGSGLKFKRCCLGKPNLAAAA